MPHFKYLVMTGYFLFCSAKDLLAVDWYLNAKVRTNQNAGIEQHRGHEQHCGQVLQSDKLHIRSSFFTSGNLTAGFTILLTVAL